MAQILVVCLCTAVQVGKLLIAVFNHPFPGLFCQELFQGPPRGEERGRVQDADVSCPGAPDLAVHPHTRFLDPESGGPNPVRRGNTPCLDYICVTEQARHVYGKYKNFERNCSFFRFQHLQVPVKNLVSDWDKDRHDQEPRLLYEKHRFPH